MVPIPAIEPKYDACRIVFLFFFNDTATTEIYTLSLHDALPIQLQEPTEPILLNEPYYLLVVLRGRRVGSIRALGVVRVTVVRTCDQRDALARLRRGPCDRGPRPHVLHDRTVAAPGSFAPKLAPTTGMPSSCSATTTAAASSRSTEQESSTSGASNSASLPASVPASTTAKCPSMCTLCGVRTIVASGRASSNRLPSSWSAACVFSAPAIAAAGTPETSTVPCGAIAAKTRLIEAN